MMKPVVIPFRLFLPMLGLVLWSGCRSAPPSSTEDYVIHTNTFPPDSTVTEPFTGPSKVKLTDGNVVMGTVFAEVDHRLWWSAEETSTLLVVGEEEEQPLITVIPEEEVLEVVVGEEVDVLSVMSSKGYVVSRLPLELERALVIRGGDGYHLEEDGYGTFAWDLVATDDSGARYRGLGANNSDYLIYGEPVYSPVAGEVVEILRGAPDNEVGSYTEGADNNLLGIHLGDEIYLYLLHFQAWTIPASIHSRDHVEVGDFLGYVGNSGVSLEPHLHLTFMVYDRFPLAPVEDEYPRMWSVPGVWQTLGWGNSPTEMIPWEEGVPQTGQWVW